MPRRVRRLAACAVGRGGDVSSALLARARPDRAAVRPDRRQARRRRACSGTSATCSPTRAHQTSPHGPAGDRLLPVGVADRPQADPVPEHQPAPPVPGLYHVHPAAHFLGMINPVILLVGLPGPGFRRRGRLAPRQRSGATDARASLGLAWFVGTLLPFVAAQRDRQPDELPLLHGDRDAGDLRRRGRSWSPGSAPRRAAGSAAWGVASRSRSIADVPVHAAAVSHSSVTSSPIGGHLLADGGRRPAGHVDHVDAGELAHPRELAAGVVAGAALHRLDVAGQQLLEAERLARGDRRAGGVRAADLLGARRRRPSRRRARRSARRAARAPSPGRPAASGGGRRSVHSCDSPSGGSSSPASSSSSARTIRWRSAGSIWLGGPRRALARAPRAAPPGPGARARPSSARGPPPAGAAGGSARSARRAGTGRCRRRRSGGRRSPAARRSRRGPARRTARR